MAEMWRPKDKSIYLNWIKTITEEASDRLNTWETDFVESVHGRLMDGRNLTEAQEEVLDRIYTEKTS